MKTVNDVIAAFELAALNAGLARNTRKTYATSIREFTELLKAGKIAGPQPARHRRRAEYHSHPKTSMKTTAKKAARKHAAKPLRKSSSTSLLTREETTNLVLQAQEAFNYQTALKRIEPGTRFDDWRRDQVMDAVGKPGISKIARPDWKTVKAHFLTLSGREDEALALLTTTGVKSYRPVDGADTWETCEEYSAIVRGNLADHIKAVATHPKGHLHEGWFLAAARQRTGKPTLTMATLAERLDPRTLHGLLSHLRNHIALREGRAVPERRAKRSYTKKPDHGEMDDPF